ncbi:MAG: dihydroorotate dehydrogenase electron transfer subunit, partial [Actinobacteria bacterium]|nr:dihydroorotate dehydrogenase electron transfer subunit [Actinomycetota bacterium]
MTLAPLGRRRLDVTQQRSHGAYRVLVVADPGGPLPQPGQFYMLTAAERWGGGVDERPFLPRAFSVLRARSGELEFMLEDVGPGTERLTELSAGDGLWALGPLGQGFRAPQEGHRAILCGGGVGTAPLALLQDRLRADGVAEVALLGFRDLAHAAGGELLEDAQIATDDGSVGHAGRVTELLSRELDADEHAVVFSCGPPAMLEAVRALCAERGVPVQLALESGMACGFGACYGCVVPV